MCLLTQTEWIQTSRDWLFWCLLGVGFLCVCVLLFFFSFSLFHYFFFSRNEEMAVSAVVARHVTWQRPPHWPAPPPRQPPCKERRASPLAASLKWRTCRAPGEASPAQPQPHGFFFLLFSSPSFFFFFPSFPPSFPLR